MTQARADATRITVTPEQLGDPAAMQRYAEAQSRLSAAIIPLQRLQEAYPELRSQQNFATLMQQLEGTENRINIAIRDYNEAVRAYNTEIRTFPSVIGATIIYGSDPMVPYQAVTPGAEVAPQVNFDRPAGNNRWPGARPRVPLFAPGSPPRCCSPPANAGRCRRRQPATKGPATPAGPGAISALTGRVVDQADLLTGSEARLTERLAALEDRTTDQFVVATSLARRADRRGLFRLARQSLEDRPGGEGQWRPAAGRTERAPHPDRDRLRSGGRNRQRPAQQIIERGLLPAFREERWRTASRRASTRLSPFSSRTKMRRGVAGA